MRKWIVAAFVLLMATGYVLQLSFHLMNLSRDDAYIGGACIAVAWVVVLLTVGKYVSKKVITSYREVKKKIAIETEAKKEQQKANEKQSSAASNPVEPTSVNNRMYN